MTDPARPLEEVLCTAYREAAGRYARLLEAAREVPAMLRQGGAADERLAHLMVLLDDVAAVDVQTAEARRAWLQRGLRPGPQLREALGQVAGLIESLQACLREAEEAAQAQKQQLLPELDAVVRGRQMQRAYAAFNGMATPSAASLGASPDWFDGENRA